MLASSYPQLEVFISTLYVVGFIFWIMLAFHVVADLFRSHDLRGGAKALWVLLILIVPLVGCLLYVLARGGTTHERSTPVAPAQQSAFEDYVRLVAQSKE